MAIANADALYDGMGIRNTGSPQDSGAVAKSSSPATVTVTVPALADGTQPTVDHGVAVIAFTGLNASAVIGALDLYASDGSTTEFLGCVPASSTATAGQGATFYVPVFSTLANITKITTLTAHVVTSGNNNMTMQMRFNYGV